MKGKKKEDQNVDASVQEGGTKCPRKVYIGRDLGGREKREDVKGSSIRYEGRGDDIQRIRNLKRDV